MSYYYSTISKNEDYAKAENFAKIACDLDAKKCTRYSFLYSDGHNIFADKNSYYIKPDAWKFIQNLDKACEVEQSIACVALGLLYHYGEFNLLKIPQDNDKAMKYYEKVCNDDVEGSICDDYRKLKKELDGD